MPTIGVHTEGERLQKRWVLGALGIAFVVHLLGAWVLGFYKIPGIEVPFNHTAPTGPFTVKSIEINPDALKAHTDDPIANQPVATPPQNPAQFNLDPNAVDHALQSPQPSLATPSVPEPDKDLSSTDMTKQVPLAESETASVTAEIAKVEPTLSGGPATSSKLAEQLINSNTGAPQPGTATGAPLTGNGATGKLPGFAELAPGFR